MRRAPPVLLRARTRLACVKHAASVRSEPGSNSRLKLEAWAKKNALRLETGEPACPSELLSLDLLRPLGLEKPNGFERILAHRIDCQRARPPCPAERHTHNLKSISVLVLVVNLEPVWIAAFSTARFRALPRATILA